MPKFQIERSIVIEAPAKQIFETLVDFKTWTTWSPWLIADPEAKVTVSSDSASVGSTYAWLGKITGEGQMKHRSLRPHSLIEDDLNFVKPFKSSANVTLQLSPVGSGTKVTWGMNSSLPWFLFFMVPMMKTLIAMDYARGLAMLKEWIETGSISSKSIVHGIEPNKGFRMLGIASSSAVAEIGSSMENAFRDAKAEFERLRLPLDGAMVSVYTDFKMKEGVFKYISGYIVPESIEIPSDCQLKSWTLPAGKVFRVEHVGSYKHLGNPWSIGSQIVRHKKLKQSRLGTYEIYRTTPPKPESELVTDICFPLR
jgi:effector-binding domain-containing protein